MSLCRVLHRCSVGARLRCPRSSLAMVVEADAAAADDDDELSVAARRSYSTAQAVKRIPLNNACEEPICPQHNPATKPPRGVVPKCIFVRHPCEHHHGSTCKCCACRLCAEADGGEMSRLENIHDACCECDFCHAPHDHGCQCKQCAALASGGLLRKLRYAKHPATCRRRSAPCATPDEASKLEQARNECACLMKHPRTCECAQCERCRADVEAFRKRAVRTAERHQQLLGIIEKQECGHGADCPCLKCTATRLRVEMTMANEHLASCCNANICGPHCRCAICIACIQRKRTATVLPADDCW